MTKDGGLSIEDTVTEIKGHIGEPRNYGINSVQCILPVPDTSTYNYTAIQ